MLIWNVLRRVNASYNLDEGVYVLRSYIEINDSVFSGNFYPFQFYPYDSSCQNSDMNNNTGNGKDILFYNSAVNISGWDNNFSQIILCDADNSAIQNVNYSSYASEKDIPIFSVQSTNVSISGLDVGDAYMGAYFGVDSGSTNITDSVFRDGYFGIYFSDADVGSSLIRNVSVISPDYYGIYLVSSGTGNVVDNVTVIEGSSRGIVFSYSESAGVYNSTVSGCTHGVTLFRSDNSIISDNIITDNSVAGIYLDEWSANDPANISIYNNFFNNSGTYDNIWSEVDSLDDNYLNTTKQVGSNIYNSSNPYICGNFWATSDVDEGTNNSVDCVDNDTDGFCDEAFNFSLAGNGALMDWCPLSDEYVANVVPNNVTPSLVSTDDLNLTTSDLNCSGLITDDDGDDLNVSVRWYKDSVLNTTVDYNESYSNGTVFSSVLDSGNTSKGENWSCSLRVFDSSLWSSWGNSSEVEIMNSLPTVSLIGPLDWSAGTNRSLEFNWSGSDADNDSLTYEILIEENMYTGADDCNDDRSDDSVADEFYVPVTDLLCFYDNGFYYNWSVRAHDGVDWGDWSGVWHHNVSAEVLISLANSDVSFPLLIPGEIEDTVDDVPNPFVIDNDGNSVVNISLNSSGLWDTEPVSSSYYQFKVDNVTGESGAFSWLKSVVSWFNIPITGGVIGLAELNYPSGADSAEVDIRLEVPGVEGPGTKNATIVFVGVLAE